MAFLQNITIENENSLVHISPLSAFYPFGKDHLNSYEKRKLDVKDTLLDVKDNPLQGFWEEQRGHRTTAEAPSPPPLIRHHSSSWGAQLIPSHTAGGRQ